MFLEYEHMKNFYQINYNLQEYVGINWVATEKIHGCNYSFMCDNHLNVIPCKRTSVINYEEDFMNHQKIFDKYKNDIIDIYHNLKQEYGEDLTQIQLYGELFGGIYHKKTSKNSVVIQKKMNYCIENEFMAYDLKINLLSQNGLKNYFYYDFEKMIELFDITKINMKLVPIIIIDEIDKIINLNPVFESKVYSHYNLDKIENNFAEGLVIKPLKEIKNKYGERIIFKYKNPAFMEVKKVNNINLLSNNKTPKNKYIAIIKNYITENRYDNVKSKLSNSELDEAIFNELFYKDVIQDFMDDYGNEISEKELEECKKILHKINIKIFI